jgi:hypothetical protein
MVFTVKDLPVRFCNSTDTRLRHIWPKRRFEISEIVILRMGSNDNGDNDYTIRNSRSGEIYKSKQPVQGMQNAVVFKTIKSSLSIVSLDDPVVLLKPRELFRVMVSIEADERVEGRMPRAEEL